MKAIGNRAVLIGLASVLFGVSCFAVGEAGFELVTAEEFQLEKDARSLLTRGPATRP